MRDNNLIYGHLSILEKYSNGINELFHKAIREYSKKIIALEYNYK